MNILPPLPERKHKGEAKVTPKVLQWFRENHTGSCAIEIKATNKARIPESALKDHQKLALIDATTRGIVHKIADNKTKNPFDAFMLKGVSSYVVACFTTQGICLVIPVEEWHGAFVDMKALYTINL